MHSTTQWRFITYLPQWFTVRIAKTGPKELQICRSQDFKIQVELKYK